MAEGPSSCDRNAFDDGILCCHQRRWQGCRRNCALRLLAWSGWDIALPYRGCWGNSSAGQRAVGVSHAKLRSLGEQAMATLGIGSLLRKLRCSRISQDEARRVSEALSRRCRADVSVRPAISIVNAAKLTVKGAGPPMLVQAVEQLDRVLSGLTPTLSLDQIVHVYAVACDPRIWS
jgi:hypothetical protein